MKSGARYLRPAASIAGIALFFCLLKRAGFAAVLNNVRVLGWGVLLLILLSGVRLLLRTQAWSYCIQTNGRRPALLSLFGPKLVGEALTDLTPAGPLLGEPARVVAVSRLVPTQAGLSSVVLENLVYILAVILFMLSGLVVAIGSLAASPGLRWVTYATVICSGLSMVFAFWVLSRRVLVLGRILDYLRRFGLRSTLLDRHEHALRAVEQTIRDFFLTRRRAFLAALALEIATNFTGIGEAYLILKVTAAHNSLFVAYLVESATRAAQLAFTFVPLGLGVQEGTTAATLQVLGYAASEGVSLAVIRRIRTLFWMAIGLLFVAKYSVDSPAAEKSMA